MNKDELIKILEKTNEDLLLGLIDQEQKYEKLKKINSEQKKALGEDYLFEKMFNPRFKVAMDYLCPDCKQKIEGLLVF